MSKEKRSTGNILTYTGATIDPLHPDSEKIHIEDIAHSLSMLCRANGHFRSFHSVAQHCIECYEEAKARGLSRRVQVFCFLHDAAEAYLGDFVSPVKYRMDDYREAEDRLLHAVYRKFAGSIPSKEEEEAVKEIDHTLLYYEFQALMGQPVGPEPPVPLQSFPTFEERAWREVEKDYIKLFNKITQSSFCPGGRKWIFFDVDDTLYDQRETFCTAFRETIGRGKDFSASLLDQVYLRSMYYNEKRFDEIQKGTLNSNRIIEYRILHACEDYDIPVSPDQAVGFRKHYIEAQGELRLTPVMEELLDLLRGKMGVGIITNGRYEHQLRKIQALGLTRWVGERNILISGGFGKAKPDPDIFMEAQNRTGADVADMIYVGDSYERDVVGAKKAGWTAIWMNRRGHTLPEGGLIPDDVVHTEKELADLIGSMVSG